MKLYNAEDVFVIVGLVVSDFGYRIFVKLLISQFGCFVHGFGMAMAMARKGGAADSVP